jgi:hypothetical protein
MVKLWMYNKEWITNQIPLFLVKYWSYSIDNIDVFRPGNSITSGGVQLVLWAQTALLVKRV